MCFKGVCRTTLYRKGALQNNEKLKVTMNGGSTGYRPSVEVSDPSMLSPKVTPFGSPPITALSPKLQSPSRLTLTPRRDEPIFHMKSLFSHLRHSASETESLDTLTSSEPLATRNQLKLMAYLYELNILLEKEYKMARQVETLDPSIEKYVRRLEKKVAEALAKVAPAAVTPEELMVSYGFARLFPMAAKRLCKTQAVPPGAPASDYLSFIWLVNNITNMCRKIEETLDSSNHKYMAHQMALLYQCLNQVRAHLEPFKKRIESRFDEIKRASEVQGKEESQLSDELKEWFRELLGDILVRVEELNPVMVRKVAPWFSVLRQMSKPDFQFVLEEDEDVE